MTDATLSSPIGKPLRKGLVGWAAAAVAVVLIVIGGVTGLIAEGTIAYRILIGPFVEMVTIPDLFVQTI